MSNLRLVVRKGSCAGHVFELQQSMLTLGRSKENDIQIEDSQVSRRHASLTWTGAGYVVRDLGSTNGTFVNSQRINAPTLVQPGDVLGIGDSVLMDLQGSLELDKTIAASPEPAPAAPGYLPPQAPAYIPPPPPPPPPVSLESEPGRNNRTLAIGCGLVLLLFVCALASCFLVYQFAPPEMAGPICQLLGPLPLLHALCQ